MSTLQSIHIQTIVVNLHSTYFNSLYQSHVPAGRQSKLYETVKKPHCPYDFLFIILVPILKGSKITFERFFA